MDALLSDPIFRLYGICVAVLVLKMMLTGAYTSMLRIGRKVYAAPEDYAFQGLSPTAAADEDIERVRRAHRNDLENILPFFSIGLLYVLTDPSPGTARLTLLGFTIARVLHTVCYVLRLQPWRTIVFLVGVVMLLWITLATLVALL